MEKQQLLEKLWEDENFTSQFAKLSKQEQHVLNEYIEDLAFKVSFISEKFNQFSKNPEDIDKINRDLEAIITGKK